MYGPYTTLSALNEALSNAPDHMYVGQLFDRLDWKPIDNIEVYRHYKTLYATTFSYTPALQYLYEAVLSNPEFTPYVFVKVYPGNIPAKLLPTFAQGLSKEELFRQLEHLIKNGYLPSYLRIYLVSGFSHDDFDELVNEAWKVAEAAARTNKPKKEYINYLTLVAKKLWNHGKYVIGWSEQRFRSKTAPGDQSSTNFEFEVRGTGYPTGKDRSRFTDAGVKFLAQTQTRSKQKEVTAAVEQQFNDYAWMLFDKYLHSALLPTLTKQFSSGEVASKYDTNTGREVSPGPHPETEKQKPKSWRTDAKRSKVIGSIKSTDFKFDVVTADPAYRMEVRADGTVKKGLESIDQRATEFIPAGPVTSWVENDEYKVIFGIHFNNPLLKLDLNDQTYWYSNRNHFMYAAQRYAILTGDRPNIAFIIYNKMGNRANMPITQTELRKKGGHLALDILQKIDVVVRAFWNHTERGQQFFPAAISKWLGVSAEKYYTPDNPYKERPEEIDKDAWWAYLKYVRSELTKGLGLNFKASLSKKEQRIAANLKHSRQDIMKRYSVNRSKRYTGERDEKGNIAERWGVYLIEYLVAYGESETGAAPSFGIPVNIVRGDKKPEDSIPPHNTVYKISRDQLEKALRKFWPGSVNKTSVHEWQFIPGNTTAAFPYARLILPLVLDNKEFVARTNERLPDNIRKTAHGFSIDGTEYYAYVMVVFMPPSVVEKEFKWLNRDGSSRKIITDPAMLRRLVAGRGLIQGHAPKGNSITGLRLTSRPIGIRTIASPHATVSPEGVDPAGLFGGEGAASVLTPDYFLSQVGERWQPIVSNLLQEAGKAAYTAIYDFEHINSSEARHEVLKRWLQEVSRQEQKTEAVLRRYLQMVVSHDARIGKTSSSDVGRRIQPYFEYVKYPISATGDTVKVPQLSYKLAMDMWTAPIGSTYHKNILLTIKAPSEDIAKLTILYRLLRRSVRNPELKNAMATKSVLSGLKIIPDVNARLLAQWGSAKFIVIPAQGGRARFRAPRNIITSKEYAAKRAQQGGDHRFIKMLGFE